MRMSGEELSSLEVLRTKWERCDARRRLLERYL